jgi:uncharacterized protein/RNA polymerase subunit RPABC4/transcription elongation factor Spt4
MRASAIIGIAAIVVAFAAFVSSKPANSQSPNNNARCLSLSNIDQRVACLESAAAEARAAPSSEDRELDCRNPQDAAQCRELETRQGIQSTPKPSFDCAKATYSDEQAICSNAELAQLDNVASAGYEYVRRTNGAQFAKSVTLPLLQARRACGSNVACIKQQQLAAIQKFQTLGAPISGPQISQPSEERNAETNIVKATENTTTLPQPIQKTTSTDNFANIVIPIVGLALLAGFIWFAVDAYRKQQKQNAERLIMSNAAMEEPTGTTTPREENPAARTQVDLKRAPESEVPLKPCRACNAQVGNEAKFCPHCGVRSPTASDPSPILATSDGEQTKKAKRGRHPALIASLFVIGIFLFIIFVADDNGENDRFDARDPNRLVDWIMKYHSQSGGTHYYNIHFSDGVLSMESGEWNLRIYSAGEEVADILKAYTKAALNGSALKFIQITDRAELFDKYGASVGVRPVLTIRFDATEAMKYKDINAFHMVDTATIDFVHPAVIGAKKEYCEKSGQLSPNFCLYY